MTSQATPRLKKVFSLSILTKCLLIIAAATLSVASVLTYKADRTTTQVAREGMQILARDVTELTAGQLEGAVRFGKVDIISATIQDLIDKHPNKISSIIVLDKESKTVAQTGTSVGPDLITLGQTAVLTGSLETTADGFWVAYPIGAASNGAASGALAIAWSDAALMATLHDARLASFAWSGGVFLIALIAAGLFFRQSLAVPLTRVARRTAEMTNGDLTSDVSGQTRGDEIGLLSRELGTLRAQLHAAETATKDAHFISAGFLGSSAALAMTDTNLTLTHHNTSFQAFLSKVGGALLTADTDPERILGASMRDVLNDGGAIDAMVSGGTFPIWRDLRVDPFIVTLQINRVLNDAEDVVGFIFEWEDITVSGTNTAIIQALEADQLRADFDTDARLKSNNSAMSTQFPDLTTTTLDQIIYPTSTGISLDQAASGKAVFDKFEVRHGGHSVIASGSVTPTLDRDGRLTGYVFLGKDITDTEVAKKEALANAQALEDDQRQVVQSLSEALTKLSQGDLSTRLSTPFNGTYEALRGHFNASVQALDDAISLVMDNSGAILGEAGNISSAADDLSRRTEKQAATLEEFAAALTQITASVASAADGASKASDVVTDARKNAEASGSVVREAVDAMGEIASSSDQISRIISVIDDIAFQTNLLALNAGVEAARAGDAGRGFAVVASEVRALAQRSSEAAREINTLISTSGNQVKRGVSLVDNAGVALNEIVTSVGDIEDHVTGIAASAREQSTGLEEINTAISQLDQVTQQNVAMFEETTAATHTLTAEATALVTTTGKFRITGSSDIPATDPAPVPEAPDTPANVTAPPPPRPTPTPGSITDGALAIADDDDWEDF